MKSDITVCIHQPNFLPWIGFIHKVFLSDVFVILDDVMFSKQDYQNRNTILTANGPLQLSVPVKSNPERRYINNIEISYQTNWRKKHLESIYYSYKKASYFQPFYERLEHIYDSDFVRLYDLNVAIIKCILDYLKINTKIVLSSNLGSATGKTMRLVDICEKLGASNYIYGGTADYMDRTLFYQKQINLISQNFNHPTYSQMHSISFVSCLSIVDWIFQHPAEHIVSYLESERGKLSIDNQKYSSLVQ